jgi:hypothetical protein
MSVPNVDFDALKDVTRLAWLLNFEAVATAGNDDDSVSPPLPE